MDWRIVAAAAHYGAARAPKKNMIRKRKAVRCAALGCVLGVWWPAGNASAHHGGFEICNESGNTYHVSIAYRSGFGIFLDKWRLNGPYVINARTCMSIFQPMSDALHMYVGVRKPGFFFGYSDVRFSLSSFRTSGRFGDTANIMLCTKEDRFSRTGSLSSLKSCPGGYSEQNFSIYLNVPAIPLSRHYINTLYLN